MAEEIKIPSVDGKSMDITATEKEKLKAVFPECFNEGKLDVDKLLNLCGEFIDNDFEKYKFEWKGKAECHRIAAKRSTGTLRPCPEESVDFDKTNNLYIEGDNLEVLKLLQSAYYRKVKMIYIDPPYNTGNDFVYEDDFKDPLARYKEVTAQTTKSNPETMGRYHTNWLNMMYPRLRLAANLLRDDGVIFISIDDNEQHNLRKLCDEVFGEENFVTNIIWQKKYSPQNDAKWFSDNHDFILCYAKNKEVWRPHLLPRTDEMNARYSNPDNDPKGPWKLITLHAKSGNNSDFTYTFKNGVKWSPPSGTFARFSMDTLKQYDDNNKIWFGKDGKSTPAVKNYLSEVKQGVTPLTVWLYEDVGHTHEAKEDVKNCFDGENPFDTPKPVKLLNRLLHISGCDENDIILDFFSGSATTAHAVMALNAEDGGNRQFIMVQLPEITDEKSEAFKAGYKNICEIGKERIRRAGAKIKKEFNEKNPVITIASSRAMEKMELAQGHTDWGKEDKYNETSITETRKTLDTGFKVFKLDTSNLVKWDDTPIDVNAENAQAKLFARFADMKKTIKADRSEQEVVFEVMLKLGIPLTYPLKTVELNGRRLFLIGEDGLVLVCLDGSNGGITPEDITAMCELAPAKIVAAEQAFADDVALANAFYITKDNGIEIELL